MKNKKLRIRSILVPIILAGTIIYVGTKSGQKYKEYNLHNDYVSEAKIEESSEDNIERKRSILTEQEKTFLGFGVLFAAFLIADGHTKSNICGNGPCKIDAYKEYFSTLTDEEKEEVIKKNKAVALYNLLGKEKYTEYLERQEDVDNVKYYISSNSPEAFDESMLKEKKEKENNELKEAKRPKIYIRKNQDQ